MSAQRIPFERQRQMWIDFYHQYPDAEWAEQCQQQIVRIDRIIDFERAALDTPSPSPGPVATLPAGPYAERRFMWLGDRRDIRIDVLRDGITRLAKAGCIRPEREQQDAMRRGLGVDLNDSERHSGIPWVYWLADDAQLHFLIASLWDMGLIHAAILGALPQLLGSGEIRRLVVKRINSLEPRELDALLKDLMKKELHAIEWLGALLGGILGAVTYFAGRMI